VDTHYFREIKRILARDVEAISVFVEAIALSCADGSIKEKGRPDITGLEAYRLWAARVKKGTGIVVRSPRFTKIFYGGIPRDLFGTEETGLPNIKKDQVLDYATVFSVCTARAGLRVEIFSQYGRRRGKLGFISKNGAPCYYSRGSVNQGYMVGVDDKVTALESRLNSSSGERIETLYGPVSKVEHLAMETNPGSYAIASSDDRYIFGTTGHNTLEKLSLSGQSPALYREDHAKCALELLRAHVTECEWRMVSFEELKAQVIADLIASA